MIRWFGRESRGYQALIVERSEETVLTEIPRHLVKNTREHTPNNPFQEPAPGRSLHWQEDAACRTVDSELFFPPMGASRREVRAAERQAKNLCFECPVRAECLEAALEADERYGVWGGMSARERRRKFARKNTKRQESSR